MNRAHLFIATGTTLAILALPGQALAQDATPAADSGMAGAVTCTVEPRDIDELLPLWFDEEGNPAATPTMEMAPVESDNLPQGDPVDAATLAEIEQTTREWAACFIMGSQYARGFSLMTDELAAMYGPDTTLPEEDTADEVRTLLEGQLAGTPIPGDEPMGTMAELTGPDDARMLGDDRAGAIWAMAGDQVFIEYERQGERWLLANISDIQEGMATPAA